MAKREKETPSITVNNITVGQLNRGNQTVQTWFNAIKSAESLLAPNRRPYYNTCLDITIDGYLDSLMDKRIRGVKNLPFEWIGLENDNVRENLEGPWFREAIRFMQERIFWGTTLVEFGTGPDGLFNEVTLIPRQNVKPEKGVIMKDGYTDAGEANVIRYREGIYANYILEIGKPRELGKLANIAAYVLMKRQNLADLSRYNEMFGMDLRVYEYDPVKPGARAEADRSAREYGSAAYIVLPRGMADVKFIASNKQSSSSAYETLHDILKNEITISILGQSLTTGGEGGGSYELGKVHQAVEQQIALEDRMTAEYIINYQLKKMLIAHGYPLEGIKGVFKVPDTLPKEMKANMWVSLAKAGLPIAAEDFYKEFGVPMPNGRAVLVPPPAPPANPNPNDPPDPDPAAPKPAGGPGAKKLSLSAKLQELYAHQCTRDKSPKRITLSYKSDLNEIIDSIIGKLNSGELKAGDVDAALYNAIAQELWKGAEKGYGVKLSAATGTDIDMLKALRENVYRFSGFKTYNFIQEANGLLIGENGNLKAFTDFRTDVLKLNELYNIDHLRTEYNHAVATSRMASKWQKFNADKTALPLLQFDTVGDGRVRIAHQKLDGIIKPVGDPFWDKYLPPLDWNCRCTVRQLADGEVTATNESNLPQVKKEFTYNWGKEKFIFPPTHPQFNVDVPQGTIDKNFDLPLPE
jgi:SPP1 gp7 family putative phage head morphogenesis protein